MSELLRGEVSAMGYLETLNFSLCSKGDLSERLNRESIQDAVVIENPKTIEFQVGRTTLLPGLLRSVLNNKSNKVPFRVFELGDVILLS